MTDVTNNVHSSASSAVTPAPAKEEQSAISSDFETFLTMLTVQMQNQDPLNPIESSDYAVQLATFSSVEQQVQTNDLITALSDKIGLMGIGQTASWIGKEVKSSGAANFEGNPLSLTTVDDARADVSVLIVKDSAGVEVQRTAIEIEDGAFTWSGKDKDDYTFKDGHYSFEVENSANGEVVSTHPVSHYATVAEARREGSAVMLLLEGGVEVDVEDVASLRLAE